METTFSSLKNRNQKKKAKNAVLIPKRIKFRWITRLYHLLGGEQNRFSLALKRMVRKPLLKIRSVSYKSVAVPALSDGEQQELMKKMKGTLNVMAERFGVRY